VLTGLSTSTGQVEMTRDVDPPGADTAALLQRTGLTLAGGRVVFGFGGNDGDCATYRGRVVSVPEAGGVPAIFTVDAKAGQSQGAVWMGGAAPAVDARGDVWVSAGNGSVYQASRGYDDSDSVLDLSPSMRLRQYFAPADWASENSRDLDMSAEPVLLPGGQVLLAGKSRIAYLLNGAHLGGIGGELATLGPVCGADIDGGPAVTGSTVYLPCAGAGIAAVRAATSPPGLRLLWSSRTGGGPPIVAGGLVWTISLTGTLYGLDPQTGQPLPHPQRWRGPAAGPGRQPGGRVPGHRVGGRSGQPGRYRPGRHGSGQHGPGGADQPAGAGGWPGLRERGAVRRCYRGHRGRWGGAARRGGLAGVAAAAAPRPMIDP
jgi:hypothetical protein